jgi:hypothetical protein
MVLSISQPVATPCDAITVEPGISFRFIRFIMKEMGDGLARSPSHL